MAIVYDSDLSKCLWSYHSHFYIFNDHVLDTWSKLKEKGVVLEIINHKKYIFVSMDNNKFLIYSKKSNMLTVGKNMYCVIYSESIYGICEWNPWWLSNHARSFADLVRVIRNDPNKTEDYHPQKIQSRNIDL